MTPADPGLHETPADAPRRFGSALRWRGRLLSGCDFVAWLRLLYRNRFAVDLRCLPAAVNITVLSVFHTILRCMQNFYFGRRVAATEITEDPVFIIGHWRTGTTLLHELLSLDRRHTAPTTYECFDPNHFLLTERSTAGLVPFPAQSRGLIDKMDMGWDKPQEEEFALLCLGQPSTVEAMAFPKHADTYWNYRNHKNFSPGARRRWKSAYVRFLKQITFMRKKRIVLKCPVNTFRVKTLLEMFPGAFFVNIVRNPYDVFPSTVRLVRTLYLSEGFHRPDLHNIEDSVLDMYVDMQRTLESSLGLIDPGRFYELRFEDLIEEPVEHLASLYRHFGFDGFDEAAPLIEKEMESRAGYRPNRHTLTAEQVKKINDLWGPYIEKNGYELRTVGP